MGLHTLHFPIYHWPRTRCLCQLAADWIPTAFQRAQRRCGRHADNHAGTGFALRSHRGGRLRTWFLDTERRSSLPDRTFSTTTHDNSPPFTRKNASQNACDKRFARTYTEQRGRRTIPFMPAYGSNVATEQHLPYCMRFANVPFFLSALLPAFVSLSCFFLGTGLFLPLPILYSVVYNVHRATFTGFVVGVRRV